MASIYRSFKVQPIYPRRALERGTQGFAITSFTITESGTVENAVALEGYCGDPDDPNAE
jgi:protein TonB